MNTRKMARPGARTGLQTLVFLLGMAPILSAYAEGETRLSVALLQMEPDGANTAFNLDKAERFCRQAAAKGADIALMPEMWSIGYTRFDPEKAGSKQALFAKALSKESAEINRFARLAAELKMAIGVTYLEAYTPSPRNALTLFDRHGNEVFTYAKVHTSDFKALEANMTPGDAFFVENLDTQRGPVHVGAMICFDREQPESARILMLQGAEIILTPNACRLDEMRLMQFRVRAWENALGVAMANYPAPQQNGHSVAFDAQGECLVQADEKEGIYLASFELGALRERRLKTIWGNAYRRPHRYGPLSSPDKAGVWNRRDGNGVPYEAGKR